PAQLYGFLPPLRGKVRKGGVINPQHATDLVADRFAREEHMSVPEANDPQSLRLEPALRVASPIACSSWCPPSHLDDGSGGLDAAPSTLLVPAPWARASYLNALRRRRRSGALRLPRRHGRYHPTLRVR